MSKETKIGAVVVLIIAVILVTAIAARRISVRNSEADRIADIGGGRDGMTIDDLRKTIAAYEKQLDAFITASDKSGTYWKILAARLQDKEQHGEALLALQNAVAYRPEDEALFYMTGVSAGIMATSDLDFPDRQTDKNAESYFRLAEQAYLRSIELNSNYDKPLYGLGVLYVFELNRPMDAISYLQRYIDLNSRNPDGAADAMFVLARAYYVLGDVNRAVEQYDLITTTTKDKNRVENAHILRQQALTNG